MLNTFNKHTIGEHVKLIVYITRHQIAPTPLLANMNNSKPRAKQADYQTVCMFTCLPLKKKNIST